MRLLVAVHEASHEEHTAFTISEPRDDDGVPAFTFGMLTKAAQWQTRLASVADMEEGVAERARVAKERGSRRKDVEHAHTRTAFAALAAFATAFAAAAFATAAFATAIYATTDDAAAAFAFAAATAASMVSKAFATAIALAGAAARLLATLKGVLCLEPLLTQVVRLCRPHVRERFAQLRVQRRHLGAPL
jgi:Mn2+/Fe2+ NRAMP family transporter